jgi:hypothetical protein
MGIDPRRWWVLIKIVPFCAGMGAIMVARAGRDGPFSIASVATGAGLGAVVAGLLVGIPLLLVYRGQDSRRRFVAGQLPGALVIQARTDGPFLRAMSILVPGATLKGSLATVAFERSGVSIWMGTGVGGPVLSVPARDVVEVSVGTPYRPPTYRAATYARMRVIVRATDSVVDLDFGVEHIPGPASSRFTKTDGELVELVRLATELVGIRAKAPRGDARELTRVPGVTGWAAMRLARVGMFAAPMVVLPLAAWLIVGRGSPGAVFPMFAVVVVALAFQLVTAQVASRAVSRERIAGYTTLNGAHLDLPQLHPHNGRVVRAAGDAPISNDEFKRVLAST